MSLTDGFFDSSGGPVGDEPSRKLFLIIAIGLVGMLVLGLLGIGGYVLFSRTIRARSAQVAQAPTETPMGMPIEEEGAEKTPTPTLTRTKTPTPRPTDTPTRAPTFTPVVIPTVVTPIVARESPAATRVAGGEGADATTVAMATTPTPTFTPVAVSSGDTTPQTGLSLGGVVGIGLVLAALTVAARRLRSAD